MDQTAHTVHHTADSTAGARVFPALAVLGMCIIAAATVGAQDDDLDVLLDRLASYLETYEPALSAVVADERYIQEEVRRGVTRDRRVLESEVMFLRLPGFAEWFGVRDTQRVNGKPVEGAGIRLRDLFTDPRRDLLDRAAAIVEASSRHNLGGRRTINMPTVPLEALSPRNHPRYIFKVRGGSRISGVQVRRLDFEEFEEPTLVQAIDGTSVWSRGSAWVDARTGAIWRAELVVGPNRPGTFRRVELESRIRVEFTRDAALNLLVPKELVENFWIRGGIGNGRGRYSNFRQFATAARIIPEP
jgi:hypothetical protein